MADKHLQRSMPHFSLKPGEGSSALQHHRCVRVPGLTDWPIRHFRTLKDSSPHLLRYPSLIQGGAPRDFDTVNWPTLQ
jgi:hypothetical protein